MTSQCFGVGPVSGEVAALAGVGPVITPALDATPSAYRGDDDGPLSGAMSGTGPLVLPSATLAGIGPVLVSTAAAKTFGGMDRGASGLYQGFTGKSSGTASARQTFFAIDPGTAVFRQAFAGKDTGEAGFYQSFAGGDTGTAKLGGISFYGSDQGTASLYQAIWGGDKGGASLRQSFTGNDTGTATLLQAFAGMDSGLAKLQGVYLGRDNGFASLYQGFGGSDKGAASLHQTFGGKDTGVCGWSQTFMGADKGQTKCICTFQGQDVGAARQAQSGLEGYRLYLGTDSEPDFTAPWQEFASMPFTTPALGVGHTYRLALRYRNAYGLESANTAAWVVTPSGPSAPPSAPTSITASPAAGGAIRLAALYDFRVDGDLAADQWLIYLSSDGSDPDPETDIPEEVDIWTGFAVASLDWTSIGFADGTVIKALVRVRRSSDSIASTNTATATATATATGPDAVQGVIIATPGAGESKGF